jgi:dihydroflavonol-4-reductase
MMQQTEMVDPALQGTQSALDAAVRNGVKRLVVTSSINAITDEPVKLYTEEDWNVKSSVKRNAYHYSKTVSERLVWDFAAKNPKLEVVTILVRSPLLREPSSSPVSLTSVRVNAARRHHWRTAEPCWAVEPAERHPANVARR